MSAKKRGKPVKPAKTTKVAKKTARKAAAAKKAGKSAPKKVAKKVAKKAAGKSAPKKAARRAKAATASKSPPKKGAKKAVAKSAPKKGAAKKAVKAKPVTRKAAPKSKSVSRRDATGHLDPQYAKELHALSVEVEEPTTERAFIQGTSSKDGLAEELGEEFVESITSGEDDAQEKLSEAVAEDEGGPFVVTTGGTEFADGTDASNPEEATQEPFPKT